MVRHSNEDKFLSNVKDGIFLVADGMGGLSRGALASATAIETIERFIVQSRGEDITWPIQPQKQYTTEENRFLSAIYLANWKIFGQIRNGATNRSMGTTLTGFLVDGERLIISNVGDSRIYLIRNGTIVQVTDDHSVVMEEVRKRNMTLEEARSHPQRHVITRALGIWRSARVDISSLEYKVGDLYVLCTDGLSDMITDEDMLSLVKSDHGKPLSEVCQNLIDAANGQGGMDNITVVLVRFSE
jgi:protein phosphatase